jgi:DNA polymerase-1
MVGEKEVDAKLGFEADKIAVQGVCAETRVIIIPGVFGVGEVTATKIIAKVRLLGGNYSNIEKIEPESLKKKLLESYEQALMSKRLAQNSFRCSFSDYLEECKYSDLNKIKVKETLEKYNFKSLIKRLGFSVDEKKRIKNRKFRINNFLFVDFKDLEKLSFIAWIF